MLILISWPWIETYPLYWCFINAIDDIFSTTFATRRLKQQAKKKTLPPPKKTNIHTFNEHDQVLTFFLTLYKIANLFLWVKHCFFRPYIWLHNSFALYVQKLSWIVIFFYCKSQLQIFQTFIKQKQNHEEKPHSYNCSFYISETKQTNGFSYRRILLSVFIISLLPAKLINIRAIILHNGWTSPLYWGNTSLHL